MNTKSVRNVFIVLAILSVCTMSIAMATENLTNNDTTATQTATATPTVTQTATVVQTTIQPTVTATQAPTTVATTVAVKKFRVGPTVKIRPVNDQIKKDQDGTVEIYMDNPSLNDVDLHVDARISVPSGIHVYGQGFGEAGAAGTVMGTFDIPPGKARTIYITIKAEKIGDFSAQFSGLYYPGDNKDDFQPMSLTHPFKVLEASRSPNEPGATGPADQKPPEKSPGISIFAAIFIIVILGYVLRKR